MFKEINIRDLNESAVKLIGDEWMLVGAGSDEKFNMMTASWGTLGEMWGMDIATIVLRPQRYTREFVESNDNFSLSFFGDGAQKTIHAVCGSKSGRDIDKAKESNLTPLFSDGTVYFEEARIVIICKKVYAYDIDPKNFIGVDDERWYPQKDYHRAYVGQILKVLVKE